MFFKRLFGSVISFLMPGNIGRIFSFLGEKWKGEDFGGRCLILIFFSPSLCALAALLLYIAHVVVFKLPAILLTLIGLVFLFALFWSGAIFLYEKMRGPMTTRSHDNTWNDKGFHP
jgi:hypothetical protein